MTVTNIAALVVGPSADDAQDFLRALQPDVQFAASDFTATLRKAVLSHTEDNFEICFISDSFPDEDVSSFINDMKQMGKDKTCLFVKLCASLPEEFNRGSLEPQGFGTVITNKGTAADKQALQSALDNRFYVKEVRKRKVNVDEMMESLLKEIDRAAMDHRRGVHRKMIAIPMDGIEIDTQFDMAVLDSYFESLQKKTEGAAPRTIERLEIPDEVLKRALPELTKDGYKGASQRVWELLSAKYGVPIPGAKQAEAPAQEKKEEASSASAEQNAESPEEPTSESGS